MKSYKPLALDFLEKWATREKPHHEALKSETIQTDAVASALGYFQVARTFKDLKLEPNRAYIVKLLQNTTKPKLRDCSVLVDKLSQSFERRFGNRNVSAASKLLWLRYRSPIIIFDSWARKALENLEDLKGGKLKEYKDYATAWQKHYQLRKNVICECALNLKYVKKYEKEWALTAEEFEVIVKSAWFAERVFDTYLLAHGKSLSPKTK